MFELEHRQAASQLTPRVGGDLGAPQLGGGDPRDFGRARCQQYRDDAVALIEGIAPVGDQRVPVERVFRTNQGEGY